MKKKDSQNLLWTKVWTTLTFTLLLFASSAIKANVSEPMEKEKSIYLTQNSNWNLPNFENSITIQVINCFDPSAQCTYVAKVENSTETRVAIPCDFPVILKKADGTNDYKTYSEQMSIWNTNHPGINVGPSPTGSPSNSYVEIPTVAFNVFSIEKQTSIIAAPIYYRVK